ncbi:hypothetical protein B0H17DRAFT_834078, partial [Mycena rosella]
YKKKTKSKVADSVYTYTFYCAQLKGEETKNHLAADPKKRRARMKMDRFACDGWLHITVDDAEISVVTVRMTHHRCHTPYLDISISNEIKETVENLKHLTAAKVGPRLCLIYIVVNFVSQIWEAVLKGNPETELNEKQIYRHW